MLFYVRERSYVSDKKKHIEMWMLNQRYINRPNAI